MVTSDETNQRMDCAKIVETAALVNSVIDETSPGADRLHAALERLSQDETMAVVVASKLLAGWDYAISTDNPVRWQWIRELAAYMGATVTEDMVDWPAPRTRLILHPLARKQ
jgi:hypothetical protein